MIIDTHSHLYFNQFDQDKEEVFNRMKEEDVYTLQISVEEDDLSEIEALYKKKDRVLGFTAGVHPTQIGNSEGLSWVRESAEKDGVVAIGEIGLDTYHDDSKLDLQKDYFLEQAKIAKENSLPIVVHCRGGKEGGDSDNKKTCNEMLELIDEVGNLKGVMHFYAGSIEQAKKFIDRGFYISFAGPLTFSNYYKELAAEVPLDSILVETDSPFAAPKPKRGMRNEPAFVRYIAEELAEVKDISLGELKDKLRINTKELFNINL